VEETDSKAIVRRPLASRSAVWSHAAARWLSARGLTPNQVSVSSIGFATLGGACLALAGTRDDVRAAGAWFLLSVPFIGLRMLANLLDGLMAIEGGCRSRVGELYNEVPDRFADAILLVCAGYAVTPAPWEGGLGWLTALLAVLAAYVRAFGASLTGVQDFCGPGAKPHRMYGLAAGCLCAGVAGLLGLSAAGWLVPATLGLIALGTAVTVVRRLRRLALRLHRDGTVP